MANDSMESLRQMRQAIFTDLRDVGQLVLWPSLGLDGAGTWLGRCFAYPKLTTNKSCITNTYPMGLVGMVLDI